MSKIFDNIGMSFESGLKAILSNLGVKRADFCVGYFNLRGWKLVASNIDALVGDDVYEKDAQGHATKVHRVCRLLIGMHRQPGDLVREMFAADKRIVDNAQASAWKQSVIADLRRQLTFGLQTNEDEAAFLRKRNSTSSSTTTSSTAWATSSTMRSKGENNEHSQDQQAF